MCFVCTCRNTSDLWLSKVKVVTHAHTHTHTRTHAHTQVMGCAVLQGSKSALKGRKLFGKLGILRTESEEDSDSKCVTSVCPRSNFLISLRTNVFTQP